MTTGKRSYRISHVISGLATGGAEMMLLKLLSRMDRDSFESRVLSLHDIGGVGERIRALGIPVHALGMRPRLPDPLKFLRLVGWLRQGAPDIIQTWMYNADLAGGLAARFSGRAPVVWNIQHSDLVSPDKRSTAFWTAKACTRLSRWLPSRIICCSVASRNVHAQLGYAADKMVVIPNGSDMEAYRPDAAARLSVRYELGLPDDALLIGLVARFHPQKDHHNFVQAAAMLLEHYPDIHFLLCGEGVDWENPQLVGWIEAAGIHDHCHLLGRRDDVPRIDAALDIASSSSAFGEGFPNILGEAMACEVPCVVTDVGDSALIVGDTGKVVPPRDLEALAAAWRELIDIGPEGRKRLGVAARNRAERDFGLDGVVARYEGLYNELLFPAFG